MDIFFFRVDDSADHASPDTRRASRSSSRSRSGHSLSRAAGTRSASPLIGNVETHQLRSADPCSVNIGSCSRKSQVAATQPPVPRDMILSALSEEVNLGASTFGTATSGTLASGLAPGSSGNFSGIEEGEICEPAHSGSVLMQCAKALGPPKTVSTKINQQVADMVNFLFENGIRGEDYKLICGDNTIEPPENCFSLAPVECNPEILEALCDKAKKADSSLNSVNEDIVKAAIIIVKSLLTLDKVVQDEGNPILAHTLGIINGALALLGNANHKNNLVRRFLIRREISKKNSHLCLDKLPMSRFLFGDDVSQQIQDLKKLIPKKTPSRRKKASHKEYYSPRFKPYGSKMSSSRGTDTNRCRP